MNHCFSRLSVGITYLEPRTLVIVLWFRCRKFTEPTGLSDLIQRQLWSSCCMKPLVHIRRMRVRKNSQTIGDSRRRTSLCCSSHSHLLSPTESAASFIIRKLVLKKQAILQVIAFLEQAREANVQTLSSSLHSSMCPPHLSVLGYQRESEQFSFHRFSLFLPCGVDVSNQPSPMRSICCYSPVTLFSLRSCSRPCCALDS